MTSAQDDDAVAYIIDDDEELSASLRWLLGTVDIVAEAFTSAHAFLARFDPMRPCCVILDIRMPRLSGIELLARLREHRVTAPVVMITGYGNVAMAVRALKLGASEFFEKPTDDEVLLERVQHWIEVDRVARQGERACKEIRDRLQTLSPREGQVLDCVLAGLSNKEAARRLKISPKAVELHRTNMMRKLAVRTVVDLVRQMLFCPKSQNCPLNCAGAACPMPGRSIAVGSPKPSLHLGSWRAQPMVDAPAPWGDAYSG